MPSNYKPKKSYCSPQLLSLCLFTFHSFLELFSYYLVGIRTHVHVSIWVLSRSLGATITGCILTWYVERGFSLSPSAIPGTYVHGSFLSVWFFFCLVLGSSKEMNAFSSFKEKKGREKEGNEKGSIVKEDLRSGPPLLKMVIFWPRGISEKKSKWKSYVGRCSIGYSDRLSKRLLKLHFGGVNTCLGFQKQDSIYSIFL